jgi:uncharacterized membrane protein
MPNTLDWRPLTPWAGVALVGLGAARLPGVLAWLMRPDRWRARSAPMRGLAFAGRHSLFVYLVHQPILIGLVWLVATSGAVPLVAPPQPDFSAFVAACNRSCVTAGRPEEDCDSSCRCVADAVARSGDAGGLSSGPLEGERATKLRQMADACMGR